MGIHCWDCPGASTPKSGTHGDRLCYVTSVTGRHRQQCCCCYPRPQSGVVIVSKTVVYIFMSVCLSGCNTITVESLVYVESSFSVCGYILRGYGSFSYMNVKVKVTGAKKRENHYFCNLNLRSAVALFRQKI